MSWERLGQGFLKMMQTEPVEVLFTVFSEKAKRWRHFHGFTQIELARRVGIGHSLINQIEKARRFPSMKTLLNLCHALGVDPKDFFDDRRLDIDKLFPFDYEAFKPDQ